MYAPRRALERGAIWRNGGRGDPSGVDLRRSADQASASPRRRLVSSRAVCLSSRGAPNFHAGGRCRAGSRALEPPVCAEAEKGPEVRHCGTGGTLLFTHTAEHLRTTSRTRMARPRLPLSCVSLSLSLAPSLCTTRNVGLPCPPRLQAYARRRRALNGEDDLPRLALPPRRHRRNHLGGLERLDSHRQRRRAPDSRRSTLRLRREPPLTLLDPRTRRPADSSHGFSPTSTRGTQITVLTHPDSLLFDHPPRSAISWTPERHLASRKLHAAATTTAHRPPTGPAHPPSSLSAGPSPAPTIAAPSFTGSRVVTAVAGTDWHWELRLAGVLGRSLAGQ